MSKVIISTQAVDKDKAYELIVVLLLRIAGKLGVEFNDMLKVAGIKFTEEMDIDKTA